MIILQIRTYITKQNKPNHTGGRKIWGGDYLVKAINNLDDDAAELFVKTASKQGDSFYDYLKSLDESYLNELVSSSKADIDKISKWNKQPNYELYVRDKSVYDNPKYFEQTTRKTIWPTEDGFKDGIIPQPQVISEGTCFKRYGDSSGSFLGNTTDSFETRSLAPYTDETNVHYYRLKKDYEFTVGKAEPWFGQPGGAEQFVVYKYDIYGHIIKNGDEYMRYTINDLMSDDIGVLEDITDKVLKGEIVFE